MVNSGEVEIRLDLQFPSAGHSRQRPTSTTKTTSTTTPPPTPTLKEAENTAHGKDFHEAWDS